jgi:hypothetical protein
MCFIQLPAACRAGEEMMTQMREFVNNPLKKTS